MTRNITVYFSDGTAHQYNNAPDDFTPDQVEARTKRDYSNKKIVRIDGGKKSNQPTELERDNNSPGTNQSKNLSQFNIKGLRFGMTLDEVISITNAKEDDRDAYHKANMDRIKNRDFMKPGAGLGPMPHEFQKSSASWNTALNQFSVGGITGWSANLLHSDSQTLKSLYASMPSEKIDDALESFSSAYGRPELINSKSRTKGGIELDQYYASWNVKDVVINMTRHIDRDRGSISISPKSVRDESTQKFQAAKEKAKKDFE
jgi:hypothetical protein